MATEVTTVQEIQLQDEEETTVRIRPLNITNLRLFMKAFNEVQQASGEDELLNVLVTCSGIALNQFKKQFNPTFDPNKKAGRDWLENSLDVPTMHVIIKVCSGIDLDADADPEALENQ